MRRETIDIFKCIYVAYDAHALDFKRSNEKTNKRTKNTDQTPNRTRNVTFCCCCCVFCLFCCRLTAKFLFMKNHLNNVTNAYRNKYMNIDDKRICRILMFLMRALTRNLPHYLIVMLATLHSSQNASTFFLDDERISIFLFSFSLDFFVTF